MIQNILLDSPRPFTGNALRRVIPVSSLYGRPGQVLTSNVKGE